jgi:adenylate cyclase
LAAVEIGRAADNALCLPSQSVSRNHALIRARLDGVFTIIDLGSRNGTEVNGRRIEGIVELGDGDSIRIGEYRIVYQTPATGNVAAEPSESKEVEETRLVVSHKPVTVLVMDLHDYTGLSRRLPTSEMSWLLSELGERASGIFSARRAWNFKTIADAVMGVWVHDSIGSAPNQIRQTFSAAIDIADTVRTLGQRLGQPLRTGAGVSTGEAALGAMGAPGKVDAIGDTVNLAFRLEAATRPSGDDMLVCEATRYVLGKAPPELFREQQTPLKGFNEPVRSFAIAFELLRQWLKT